MPRISLLPAACLLFSCRIAPAAPAFPDIPTITTRYAADNPANLTAPPLAQTFTVDVARGRLLAPDLGFAPILYPNGIGPATPVYFSSTGALPAPLKPDTPYYVTPAPDGGYRVFPTATDADAPLQPGGVLGEKVLPAQDVSQSVAGLAFTTAGTGIHTVITRPLLKQFTDLSPNGFNSVAVNGNDRHTMLEIVTDPAGHPFVRTAGATARENFLASYNAYGQTMLQAPAARRLAARQQVAGKRVVYQVFVGRVRSYKERQVLKFLATPARIDPATDRFTFANEPRLTDKVNTGDVVTVHAYPGSALPAPLAENTDYYARKVDKKNLTLHPTAADAASGTNPIDLTTAGSGSFLFTLPLRVGDSRRWSFFAEVLEPGPGGGNTLSARLQEPISGGILKIPAAFTTTGDNNGTLAGLAAVPPFTPVSFWTPPRAALPAPLRAGVTYWTSKQGSATRLHETLQSARDGAGKPAVASGCIQFTAPGHGEALAGYADNASAIAYGNLGAMVTFDKRVPLGPMCILAFKIDYDDPAQAGPYATLGLNEAVSEGRLIKGPKGLTPAAADDKSHAWTLFNSAQGHVPIDFDCYDIVFGSSTEAVPDSQLQKLVDYFQAKYNIPH